MTVDYRWWKDACVY
ncbi:unnamed protein product [Debaryomyces fabryi]|nr:unnamed protein product [Debaryomyces fabryi]